MVLLFLDRQSFVKGLTVCLVSGMDGVITVKVVISHPIWMDAVFNQHIETGGCHRHNKMSPLSSKTFKLFPYLILKK